VVVKLSKRTILDIKQGAVSHIAPFLCVINVISNNLLENYINISLFYMRIVSLS